MLHWIDRQTAYSMNPESQHPHSVHRACPLCERDAADTFLQKGSLRLARCRSCSMIYADPVDPDLASGRFYDRLGVPFYLSPEKLEGDYAPVRFERELRLFRSFCRSGAVLDVGCSTGAFLFQLNSRHPGAFNVTGMDVAGAALDHAAVRGIEVLREPFIDFDFSGRQYDAVTFWAVIEHLVNPKQFLGRAASILKPGGHCFILVPNMGSLAVRLLGAKYRYIMPDHLNYFTARTLKEFVVSASPLEIVKMGTSHFNPMVILKDSGGGDLRVPDEERARLLKRTTACKQNPWLAPARWCYTAAERALAALMLADNLYVVLRKRQ